MDMFGFAVLSGFIAGALWGWYFASEKASKRLDFWRNEAARAQGEHEGMIKALAQANAEREAASSRVDDLLGQIEAHKTRADRAEYRTAAQKQQFERLENEKKRWLSQVQDQNTHLRNELRREQAKNSEEAKARRNKQAAARRAKKGEA